MSSYIPQVQSSYFPYPLVACPVEDFDEKLFDWASPFHSYEYYDLTLDAEAIVQQDNEEGNERHVAERAFSKVKYWETSDT